MDRLETCKQIAMELPIAFLIPIVLLFASGVVSIEAQMAPSIASIEKTFMTPPNESRPMVRWWWFGAAVEKPEILRELRQMKADGIGGAELAFVYPEVLDDPALNLKNLPFLGQEMLAAVTYAQAEARKLDLRIDLTLCSGWPYGGPATTLTEAAGRLRIVEMPVPSKATSGVSPRLAEGETLIAAFLVSGEPKHWDPSSAKPLRKDYAVTSNTPQVALFFMASHTGQQVKRAAVGAEGFVLDPFSHEAVASHLRSVGEPLLKAFSATPPYAIFSDSLEAYGADWTPRLPDEFKKRRGYDLIPHLPEFAAGGSIAADKVRHDYGRTLTELVDENYLTQINGWAETHGTKFRSQTYGEPAVSFSSQRLAALPEGEGPQWRAFSTLRWATSANHVFGNKVSSGETFTWLHSPVFRATPLDMKAEADIDFIMGENQLIFHGWPYSPPQASANGEPGWSLYAAAVFNDRNPWHPVMPAVNDYIARISYLLRQGKPANQVAILLPTDDAWASFSPGKVSVSGAMTKLINPELMSAILAAGYNVDFIDADAIERLGISYPVVIIPPTKRVPLATMKKLREYTAAGGKVMVVGKQKFVDESGNPDADLLRISSEVLDGGARAATIADLAEALHRTVAPDLRIEAVRKTLEMSSTEDELRRSVGFIRRKLPDADIYFVANTGNQALAMFATFGSVYRAGVTIDPESAMVSSVLAVRQSIHLAPYESRIFIFSNLRTGPAKVVSVRNLADLSSDWQVRFSGDGKTVTEHSLTDWIADRATLHYSGEAAYTRDFTLESKPVEAVYLEVEGGVALPGSPNSQAEPAVLGANGIPDPLLTKPGPGMHAYYDPPLHEAALVFINGKAAGALWHPPYRIEVSKLLVRGLNHIEIRVYNTALNSWSGLPAHDYKPLIARYGDRFQMQDLDKVEPISSGLLGRILLKEEALQ
ncbi:glycosyl hydrolase [Granulicella arctica]|uniref:glycosyl hydrolase n=1 Tax=Granulicella arctica TaxID=940613 RepID=UPI0021E01519|nr:glycosyl hydrolase [Granulicella arctica]